MKYHKKQFNFPQCNYKRVLCLWCTTILAFGSTASGILHEWNYDNGVPTGIHYRHDQLAVDLAKEMETPDHKPVLAVHLIARPQTGPLHSVQLSYVSKQKIAAGAKYRISFYIKSSRKGMVGVNATVVSTQWPQIEGSMKKLNVDHRWQNAAIEFTAAKDYFAQVRTPMFMLGKFPPGETLYISPVKFEKLADFPLVLNETWKLILNPKNDCSKTIPPQAQSVRFKNHTIDLTRLTPKFNVKDEAVLYNEFTSPASGIVEIGCSADYWFDFSVNGVRVYDTMNTGNITTRYIPEDHIFSFPVKRGKNLIVVKVFSGSQGWKFVCGKPDRNRLAQVVEIKRGKNWRPVKVGNHRWKYLTPQRIPELNIKPKSALDLSLQFKHHDIDKAGRLVMSESGELVCANHPAQSIRLRGFNFLLHAWNRNFYKMKHSEIEEFAEEIRLRGMNVVRFHYLNPSLCGYAGFPKDAGETIDQVSFADSREKLPIDRGFLDRYDFLIKCLRDRGIYIIMDIVTTDGGWTAMSPWKKIPLEKRFKYRLFFDEKYRKNWRAGFDFLMNHRNPYTDKCLKNDPQLIGIVLFNEQDSIFSKDNFKIFASAWKQINPDTAPTFDKDLLKAETPYGKKARGFLMGLIKQMNRFYLEAVKESGYQGMVSLWDMFMCNLEGVGRSDMPAVAMHTYFSHPAKRKLPNVNYTQQLRYGKWLKDIMFITYQGSSITMTDSYIGRAASTRIFHRPFFLTEYSHGPYNRYVHEAGPMIGAYAALQGWNMLIPHGNTVALYFEPLNSYSFDGALSPMAMVSSLFTAFAWQRFDVATAKHSVNFYMTPELLNGPALLNAVGSSYSDLYMLTGIGSSFGRKADNVSLNIIPEQFSCMKTSSGYVDFTASEARTSLLQNLIEKLKKNRILPPDNLTNANRGIFQSETGEITADTENHTMTIDSPRLKAAVIKECEPVRLQNFEIISSSTPCTLATISLNGNESVKTSKHLLVIFATMAVAEDAVFLTKDFGQELDIGRLQPLIKTGTFKMILENANQGKPHFYALNLNGSREKELPIQWHDGKLSLTVDTSALEYGTPFFEIIFD